LLIGASKRFAELAFVYAGRRDSWFLAILIIDFTVNVLSLVRAMNQFKPGASHKLRPQYLFYRKFCSPHMPIKYVPDVEVTADCNVIMSNLVETKR